MAKDYYIILGVRQNATNDEIKDAFRALAKQVHPDRTGRTSEAFIEVHEAYRTLCDEARRKDYDQRQRQTRYACREGVPQGAEPPRRPYAEPLIPEGRGRQVIPLSGGRSIRTRSPMADGWFEWIWQNFATTTPLRWETFQPMEVLIPLTREQARTGGQARVKVPVRGICPTCRGAGGVFPHECWRCGGEGALSGEIPVSFAFPAGIPHRHTVSLALEPFGIPEARLVVHFRLRDDLTL